MRQIVGKAREPIFHDLLAGWAVEPDLQVRIGDRRLSHGMFHRLALHFLPVFAEEQWRGLSLGCLTFGSRLGGLLCENTTSDRQNAKGDRHRDETLNCREQKFS